MKRALTRSRSRAAALPTATTALLLAAACGAGDRASADTDTAAQSQSGAGGVLPVTRILEPAQGADVNGPVHVVLAAENIEIAPAGDTRPNSGHFHLFLNTEPVANGEVVPAGVAEIVHLGQAQSEHTFADLPPGEYTLIVAIGDLVHRVIPQVRDTVRFRVVQPSN